MGPAKLNYELPPLPTSELGSSYSQQFNLSHVLGRNPETGAVLERVAYEIRDEGGKLINKGYLDENGFTARVYTKAKKKLTVWLGEGDWKVIGERTH